MNAPKIIVICLALFALAGCLGTEYTSRIRNEPFDIDNTFRAQAKPSPQVKHGNGSLWPGDRYANAYYSDQRASRLGDIITIKIIEVSSATEKATTDLGRNSDMEAGITSLAGYEKRLPLPKDAIPSQLIKTNTKNNFAGTGETKREGAVTATISAKVVEVMPNGNLAVEGKREVSVNNERKEILLQGMVRQRDIAGDNSVLSTQVADAKIILTGVGVVGEKQRPGWFARAFDLVWPF